MHHSLILASLLALLPAGSLSSQPTRDSAECRAVLTAAPRDSQVVRIVLLVRPYDTVAVRMSPAYRQLIGDAIKSHLDVPHPLGLTTYDNSIEGPDGKANDKLATMTLQNSFGAVLHRDGHLTNVRALGGAPNAAFENAMIRAIHMVSDSSELTPALVPDVVFKGDSLAIRFVVSADLTSPASQPANRAPTRGKTPLVLLRVPARRATQRPSLDGGQRPPKYPDSMRAAGVVGKTALSFVIDEKGKADLSTIEVVQTPALDFVTEILEVLPSFRFKPLMVEGCPVPVVVTMPFEFHLTP